MSTAIFARPVKAAVFGFLGLIAAAMAVALAERTGVIEPAAAKRTMGLVIGVMVVVVGNLLPKMRPLNTSGGNPARATAAERFAGWTLVLAGIAYIALFALAPLDLARPASSIIGIAAMVVIAANWAWLVRDVLSRPHPSGQDTAALTQQAAEKRRLIAFLLFAFFYVLAAACAKFLLNDQRWVNELGSWMMVGFCILYAALIAVLDFKRSPEQTCFPPSEKGQ